MQYVTKLSDARNFTEVSRAEFASHIVGFLNVSLLREVNTLRNVFCISGLDFMVTLLFPFYFLMRDTFSTLIRHIIIIIIIIAVTATELSLGAVVLH